MLLIDFEKAFDSVDFGFLVATLEMFGFGEYFVNWIKIILGCNLGTNFKGVTVVNGNIFTPFNISRGCRQGDPISGYLFILVMEILALLLKRNKSIKPYRTKFGLEHFIDMYADDLSVYLEFKRKSKFENKQNIKNVLQTLDKFREWSGLSINLGKTNLTVFGKLVEKPSFVNELNIKWCVDFKLLGIQFDSTLAKMYVNYDIALEAVRKEINSWKYRFLTIYGKVTVIKNLCIPKINHIVAVVPNFSITHLKILESELKFFILDGNPSVVDETTRKMAVKDGGFGIPNINFFWKSIRMSWLRRLIGSEATWAKLHRHDVAPCSFDPCKANFVSISKAKKKTTNLFWKDVYGSLLDCRLNILVNYPQEYRYIPINGEPQITSNRIPIEQEWASHHCLNSIIDDSGNFINIDNVRCHRKPYDFEFNALKNATKDFLEVYSGGKLGANIGRGNKTGHTNADYNIYGRLVTKRKKGCAFYYSLLNTHAKSDGWVKSSIKIESDAENEGLSWECDTQYIVDIVKQVNKTPYLNRLKQFFYVY